MSENQPPSQQPPPPPPPSSPPPPPAQPSGPPAGTGGGEDTNRTIMLVLSYLGILALIPFLVEKEDREVQWHAKHGLVLTVFWFVLFTAVWIASLVASFIWEPLGCLASLLLLFLGFGVLVFHVVCIYQAVNGNRQTIPGVSDFADKL